MAAGLKEVRSTGARPGPPSANGDGGAAEPRPRWRWLPAAAVGAVCAGLVVLLLVRAVANRTAGEAITGNSVGGAQTSLQFFQQRVTQHPGDLAARLDLAQAYLDGGDVQDAVQQYLEALKIDPANADAEANLGYVLFLSGHASQGLDAVNKALVNSPNDAEAMYFKGVILLRGLRQPVQAAQAFQQYLAAAPFGARRAQVEQLLQQALALPTPTP
jgi:tetratricopeptide (TPR) repeat protein